MKLDSTLASPSSALLAAAVVTCSFAATAVGEASLWIFPDSSYPEALGDDYASDPVYVGDDPDPWLTDSYVLEEEGDLILDVYNHGRGKGDRSAYGATLIVAVNDVDLFMDGVLVVEDGPLIFLGPGDFAEGSPSLPCSGEALPGHGVYTTAFAEIPLGDIAADEIVQIDMSLGGDLGLLVHFDVVATGIRGRRGCVNLHNPFSHDTTLKDPGGGLPTLPSS